MDEWRSEITKTLIGLIGAGVGGFLSYLWQRRRTSDKELFLMLRAAFDRPAFKGLYVWHSDQQVFQQAIATTLKAVKTGRFIDRHGQELHRIEGRYLGPFQIRNLGRRKAIQEIEDRLQKIYQLSKDIEASPANPNDDTIRLIDRERDEVVRKLNLIWRGLAITEMRLPTECKGYDEMSDPLS